MFEIFLRHDARSAGGVDEVIKGNGPADVVLGDVLPFRGYGPALGVVIREDDREDAAFLENAHAGLFRIPEKDIVEISPSLCDIAFVKAREEGVTDGLRLTTFQAPLSGPILIKSVSRSRSVSLNARTPRLDQSITRFSLFADKFQSSTRLKDKTLTKGEAAAEIDWLSCRIQSSLLSPPSRQT